MSEMLTVTFDGVEYQFPPGLTILQAAQQAGIPIPHFCWHKHLSVSGNCRMCLVGVKPGPPKPQIACATPIQNGMAVTTRSESIDRARKGVLEFLLINHPLDCPVCDEAYECQLQDYTYDYGPSTSRFIPLHDRKRVYRRIDLGEKMFVEMNRCIECTRCVRFLKELGGQHELERFHRGHLLKIFTYKPAFESDFAINAADLCPVGALEDKKFRFSARNWDLAHVPTLCPSCSIGCNVRLDFFENRIKRLLPRENEAVNACWICDYGRHNFDFVNDNRLLGAQLRKDADLEDAPFDGVLDQVAGQIRQLREAHGPQSLAFLFSSWMTNEELFLGKTLAQRLQARVGVMRGFNRRPVVPVMSDILPKTLVSDDKSPNSTGAQLLGLPGGDEDLTPAHTLLSAIEAGEVRALVLFHEDLAARRDIDPVQLRKALARLDLLVVVGWTQLGVMSQATALLPSLTFAEKHGSFTNHSRRVQRLRKALEPVGEARSELEILGGLARRLDAGEGYAHPREAFADMVLQEAAFAGLDWMQLGETGCVLKD